MIGRFRRVVLVIAIALVVVPTALADPARVGPPNSIASTGDSITRAFNTGLIPFTDAPWNSWSTGSSGSVASHYRRILAVNPQIWLRNYNDAETGAEMSDLNAQVGSAVAQRAEYVTILMGANDACASSEAAMTPVADFRAQFEQAMSTLAAGLPDSRILVVSVPDLRRLWLLYKDNATARTVWSLFGICQSMLARPSSNAPADLQRRNRVRQRVVDYNTQLSQGCTSYVHCRFDGNAVFNYPFAASDVSTRDYFHPSLSGQNTLAGITWSAKFDFADRIAPVSTASTTPVAGGTRVTIGATDNAGVRGIEYRLGSGTYQRYTAPVTVGSGGSITYRAVDVNGNTEASHTLVG